MKDASLKWALTISIPVFLGGVGWLAKVERSIATIEESNKNSSQAVLEIKQDIREIKNRLETRYGSNKDDPSEARN